MEFSAVMAKGEVFETALSETSDEFGSIIVESIELLKDADTYEGDYKVVPKPEEQILKTENKYMIKDVNITGIPVYEVDNGLGDTIVIGKELLIKDGKE